MLAMLARSQDFGRNKPKECKSSLFCREELETGEEGTGTGQVFPPFLSVTFFGACWAPAAASLVGSCPSLLLGVGAALQAALRCGLSAVGGFRTTVTGSFSKTQAVCLQSKLLGSSLRGGVKKNLESAKPSELILAS